MRLGIAAAFYLAFVVAALVWGAVAGRPWLLWAEGGATLTNLVGGGAAGLALGLLFVGFSRLSLRRFRWAREMFRFFAQVLGPLRWRDALILAALSSVGEELFFRGAMQPTLGLALTSLLFGLAHLPPARRYWPWTASALVLGVLFGGLTLATGNLVGALTAHFVINALNLGHLGRFSDEQRTLQGPVVMGDPAQTLPAPGTPDEGEDPS